MDPIAPATNAGPAPANLRFGIFLAPFHGTAENPTLVLRRDLDLMERERRP